MEIWKEIEGTNGCYLISSLGRVGSSRNWKSGIKRIILKPTLTSKGYLQVHLFDKYYRVHTLVANAFLNKPSPIHQVNHKNMIKADNRLENLEWVTQAYNARHAAGGGIVIGTYEEMEKIFYHYFKLGYDRSIILRSISKKFRTSVKAINKHCNIGRYKTLVDKDFTLF